jgi:hypothetical protein
VAESGSDKRRITLELSEDLLTRIDGLKSQLGFRSRGPLVEQLLRELLSQDASDDDEPADASAAAEREPEPDGADLDRGELDETSAIILIGSALVSQRDQEKVPDETSATSKVAPSRTPAAPESGGIQLPGFVRRQARAVKRSLQEQPKPPSDERGLALIAPEDLQEALHRAQLHWREVYGQPPGDAVVDAAQSWLARDIWPQSDLSDGRPFSWGLAQQVIQSMAPSWSPGDPSLERIIAAAGILEDPFGGSSLAVRVPTLITRFVQRHRSRHKRVTSFDAFDQSLSVHGALRLLQLPTVADRPYTLKEIREAYREQAQCHHPDAGGSPEAMRRLNEAYQFLKERYRRAG